MHLWLLLKFNRFLINPTFSTVNEDYSYFNLYHRNQWVNFEDNYQTYLGSYSGRISDRSGLGLSVYHQRFGTISNFGVMANYAYGIRLSEKSNLTFGFNLSYYNSGVDKSNINPSQPDDPTIADLQDGSLLSFQPGINLSIGSFDVGIYAENAFDYNLRTNESLTDFNDKTFTGHLMYTNRFKNGVGIMEDAKLSALTRVRRVGEEDLNLSGSLILDLPKLGWIQTGYDDYYGIAAGLGFNITKRLSLGYTMEKGVSGQVSNFGLTHEINFAYSFQPTLSENRVFEDLEEDASDKDKRAQGNLFYQHHTLFGYYVMQKLYNVFMPGSNFQTFSSQIPMRASYQHAAYDKTGHTILHTLPMSNLGFRTGVVTETNPLLATQKYKQFGIAEKKDPQFIGKDYRLKMTIAQMEELQDYVRNEYNEKLLEAFPHLKDDKGYVNKLYNSPPTDEENYTGKPIPTPSI